MKSFLEVVVKGFRALFPSDRERTEAWLGQATDRVDLERRLTLLDRERRERSWMGAGF